MALITCPECGKQISDKSPFCIHCGYPMQEQSPVAPAVSNSKKVVIPSFTGYAQNEISAIKIIQKLKGLGLADAKEFVEQSDPYITVKDGLNQTQADMIAQKFLDIGVDAKIYDSSTPEGQICCPRCGSTEYHAGSRGFSLLTGFVGSGQTVLTCLHCGHRWEPGK